MTNGLPDILSSTRLGRSINLLRRDADVAREEFVTSRVQDITKATNGDVGSVHLLTKSLADNQATQRNLTLAQNRTAFTQDVLSNLSSEAARIGTEVIAANGIDADFTLQTLSTDAAATLRTIFANLNANFSERAVFGGDRTDRPPLADPETLLTDVRAILTAGPDKATIDAALDTYFNDPAGGFQTTIYQGGENDAPAVEIAPGVRIDVSVRADAQPIKDLIRSFAVIAERDNVNVPGDEATEILSEAASGALNADKDLVQVRASIGVNEQRIADSQGRFETEETLLQNLLNDRTLRDQFEAANQLQLLETQIEASYLITSRLANLTLANFL
ncbi:MAG: hypothetical protein AAF850_07045 [Pseudomonadota bacterium]